METIHRRPTSFAARSLGAVALASFVFLQSPASNAQAIDRVEAIQAKSCTVASLDGTFGLYRQGTTGVGTATPNALAAVGIIVLAKGSVVSGHQTTSRNGVFIDTVFGGLTYEVDPDCTGRLFSADGTLLGRFSIVDGGKEVFLLSMTPANAVIEVWKKVGTQEQGR